MDDPANSSWVGSPASYRAAWAHVREIFAGLPASFVWSPTAAAFASDAADRFYPGDEQVDWVAADGYNGPGCRPGTGGPPDPPAQSGWRELSDIFGDFYVWGSSHGKPLMVGETGSVEDVGDPDARPPGSTTPPGTWPPRCRSPGPGLLRRQEGLRLPGRVLQPLAGGVQAPGP